MCFISKHQDYEVATLEASTTGSSSIIKDTSSKRYID